MIIVLLLRAEKKTLLIGSARTPWQNAQLNLCTIAPKSVRFCVRRLSARERSHLFSAIRASCTNNNNKIAQVSF